MDLKELNNKELLEAFVQEHERINQFLPGLSRALYSLYLKEILGRMEEPVDHACDVCGNIKSMVENRYICLSYHGNSE